MSKTTSKYSPESRASAVRMVLAHESEHTSRRAADFHRFGAYIRILKKIRIDLVMLFQTL